MRKFLILAFLALALGSARADLLADPCNTNTLKSSVVINVASATTTQLVALVAGQKIYVCSFVFTAAVGTAATYQFEYGTGSSCGTGTTVLTGAMVGGFFLTDGNSNMNFATASGNALCLVTGGTSPNAQGFLTYVQG